MALRRLIVALLVGGGLVSAAVLSKEADATAVKMSTAASTFLSALDSKQRARAVFDFDAKERTNWHFVPYQSQKKPLRKGLPFEDMSAEQREAALQLIRSGTSASGFTKATTIMSLESILRELEKNGVMVRNPDWYFLSVFGTPSKSGKWGWRVEGHHLSLNFTLDGGRIIAATPFFFGANPAEVKAGSRKGLRTLPEARDPACKLADSLDKEQQTVAFQAKQFPEIEEGKPAARVGNPVGLAAARMSDMQKALLMELVEGYLARMPLEVAEAELARLKDAGLEKVHFAIARENDKPGQPCTYRVQGPTFVIEFLDVQSDSANNPANHIHSVWRDLPDDFGLAVH